MEDQKNLLLANVLTGVVLIGWQYLFAVPQIEKQKQLAASGKRLGPPWTITLEDGTEVTTGDEPDAAA